MTISRKAAAVVLLACGLLPAQTPERLICAGGTFPDPIYERWIATFNTHNTGLPVVYHAVGSEQAIEELKNGTVDFAASDFAPPPRAQAELGVRLIPTLVGAAVPVYNLPNVNTDLRFTANVLAGIYLGQITQWDDPRIKVLNQHAALPSERIIVVHRSDGSGTSYLWTNFLASSNSIWREKVGVSIAPDWPAGVEAKGNEGVAAFVSKTPFAIGYVEFIYALQHRLTYGSVKNPAGAFVQADVDTITVAASSAAPDSSGRLSILNASGRNAYPVCSFTWLLIPMKMASNAKRQRLALFLDWALTAGQHQVAVLGYVPLPQAVADHERELLRSLWRQ